MGRKVVEALIVITIMVAIVGMLTVMATGCGVLDDFGDFGGDDNGGTPSKKPNFGGEDDDTDTPTKRPPPTIQPFNPSKKAV